jgi:signal transduction histidine kinase/DNA-binding NarL/FixJ family response regulator
LHARFAIQGAATALVLLLLAYVSAGAYYSIIESVRRLSAGATTLADGDLSSTIHLAGQDELTEVATSFNTMASALGKLLHESQQTAVELSQALEAAKLADQTKDAFLANVSHELRTPLNAVIGLADLARRPGCTPVKQAEYLLKIADAGRTLSSIINDLLDLSKIAAGRMELDPVTFSMTQLVTRVHSIMSFKAAEKGLVLRDSISPEVPEALVGDNHRIEQVLLNLLSNAIKFTHRGHIELRVSVRSRDANRASLLLEVEDSGIGMTPEETTRLFQPFSQSDASISRKYGGTGLGLALCKQIAEMMNGSVRVSSQAGCGTTFQVALCLDIGDAAELTADYHSHDTDHEAEHVRYLGVHVLVADDQPINREIAYELLVSAGVSVRLADNGQEALDMLYAEDPAFFDAVLMDIQMPVLDGLAAVRAIKARPEFGALPVIAMTAHTMEHEKQISASAGMVDHIGKPFETREFFRILRKWIAPHKHLMATADEAPEPASVSGGSLQDRLMEISGLDPAAGLARFNGKEDRYAKWLRDFIDTSGDLATLVRSEVAAGHQEEAIRVVHTFKGRVGVLGMDVLHAQVLDLETALRGGQPAGELVDRVEQTAKTLRTTLLDVLSVAS